jgi:DSF synthase
MNDGLELATTPTTLRNNPTGSSVARPATPLPVAPTARRGYRKIDGMDSPIDGPMARTGFRELSVELDAERQILWSFMNPSERPCFTTDLLKEIRAAQTAVRQSFADAGDGREPVRYLVVGSYIPGIFNMGGHLELFASAVEAEDRSGLLQYAKLCIDCVFAHSTHLDFPVSTISLVQGDALGGGFEQALSSDVIIAEKSAKFGLPEILFGLFPGMGAYSFLSRRLGTVGAERMIKSGKIYSAEELHEMGLVDEVADDGFGREALIEYVERNSTRYHAHRAIYQTRQIVNPITYQELEAVVETWVETALKLSPSDLKKMRRLAAAQLRRGSRTPS